MNSPAKSSKGRILVEKLNALIEENLTVESFGVEELSSAVGYSRSHLHRVLQKETGKTISQFIREYRLEKALNILKEETSNVSEVAYEVGFGSASYFSKTFTKYFGFTPSEVKDRDFSGPPAEKQKSAFRLKAPKSTLNIALIFFAILVTGSTLIFLWKWLPENQRETDNPELSVALLPLRNLSVDPQNQHLVQGVGDAIARKLSGIQGLRVISQTSTSQMDLTTKSIVQIADELNTAYVLEGSIQKFGEKIRVEVGLVYGKNGIRIWSEHYDRDFRDIFLIENEIAEQVASSLKSELSPVEITAINRDYTDNAEAYDLYMKGIFELRTYTRTGVKLAHEYFKEAIELDPDFAMAYNWLGHSYIAMGSIFGAELDALDALEKAIVPIEKSLEIDPGLSEARPIHAFYYLYHDWDFRKAEEEYKKGLGSRVSEGYALYADYLNFVRRHEEALAVSRMQEVYEPYYPNSRMIMSLFYTGRTEEALDFAETRLKIMKNYWNLDSYGFVLLNSGAYQQAIDIFHEIFQIENLRYPRILGWLGAAYARSGQNVEAERILEELKARHRVSSAGSTGFFIAVVHSALGETDQALQWLGVAIDEHEMEIPWLISEPQLYDLHERPEFKMLVQKVGFPWSG